MQDTNTTHDAKTATRTELLRIYGQMESLALQDDPTGAVNSLHEQISRLRDSIGNAPLPPIVNAAKWLKTEIPKPPELVYGFLHRGSKGALGGASKSFKTWALTHMALCVATGRPWWGFPTSKSKVLYVNFELQEPFIQERINVLCEKCGIQLQDGELDIWNLRGHSADFSILLPQVTDRIKGSDYGLILIDPIYSGLGDRDENKAGDMNSLMNEIERVAVRANAAVVFAAHFSKGSQTGKDHIDRMSGSGVLARNPESIMTMTRHGEDACFTIEATLRNFKPMDSFCVRWQFPIFERDDSLDPSELREPGKAGRKKLAIPTVDEFIALFPKTTPPRVRSALRSKEELRSIFQTNQWNRESIESVRNAAIKSGALSDCVSDKNAILTGRPDAVTEFKRLL